MTNDIVRRSSPVITLKSKIKLQLERQTELDTEKAVTYPEYIKFKTNINSTKIKKSERKEKTCLYNDTRNRESNEVIGTNTAI